MNTTADTYTVTVTDGRSVFTGEASTIAGAVTQAARAARVSTRTADYVAESLVTADSVTDGPYVWTIA